MNQAIEHTGGVLKTSTSWEVLRLPEILGIFRLGLREDAEEKCPIWTF